MEQIKRKKYRTMIQTDKLGFTDKGQIVYLHRVHWKHHL